MKFLALTILFLSFSAFSQGIDSLVEANAYKREWLVLLHYKKNLLGHYKSEVDNELFFFSPEGKRDPRKEMLASVEAISRTDLEVGPTHPQCAMPARFNYLKQLFNLTVPAVECPDYKWWKENLPFHSVTLIFASYYANNPASMFGHTFLRVNSSDKKDISDYGIDFSAISSTDHGIEFAVRGLLGGYTGLFSLKPYYTKMNVYIENENRDLWEYDLKLTPPQIDRMLDHLWELLRYGHFDYFFLDENCSYQLLTLLEVANPEWNLSDEFTWKAIPIDTVKKVIDEGAVRDVHYRPAYKKSVVQKISSLNRSEKAEMHKLLRKEKKVEEESSARVLEAAIASLRYERFEEKKFTVEQEAQLKELLIKRAKIGGVVEYVDVKKTLDVEKLRPDTSHDSEKYSLAIGQNSNLDTYGELSLRASLHDGLDLDQGYPKNALIEVGHLKLRYSENKKNIFLQELKYAEAISLFPLDGHEFKWSWRAGGKSYRVYDGGCDFCVSHQLKSGGGLAANLSFIDMDLYSLILVSAEASNGFYKGYRIAPALNVGSIWSVFDGLKTHYDLEIYRDLNAPSKNKDFRLSQLFGLSYNYKLQQEWRIQARNWTSGTKARSVDEIQLGYSFYY